MEKHHLVRIFIDNKPKESPNPTTGHALYELGGINPQEYDLYEEVPHGEDKLIPNDSKEAHVHEGEHFFSVPKKINPGA